MISFFIPSVSGSLDILAGSSPAITAHACNNKPPAEPLVTKPYSEPVNSPIIFPAAMFNSSISSITVDASIIICVTSGRNFEPPYFVVVPAALIPFLTPNFSYNSSKLLMIYLRVKIVMWYKT